MTTKSTSPGKKENGFEYKYKARVVRVIDGDTVVLAIDLGFKITATENCRMLGYDAPEMRGKDRTKGLLAKAALEGLLIGPLTITTHKDKKCKYGRYLVEISTDKVEDVAKKMISLGFIKGL
jgi:micrococcal nuclease